MIHNESLIMTNELVNIYVIMHDDEEVYVGYTKNIKDR